MNFSPDGDDERCDAQSASAQDPCSKRSKELLSPWKLDKAQKFMIRRMSQQCLIEDVARECAMSRSHFSRAFKNVTGLTPQDWLKSARLQHARQLLEDQRLTISRVALECGFGDQSHFTRVFRVAHGVSPRQWRLNNGLHADAMNTHGIQSKAPDLLP